MLGIITAVTQGRFGFIRPDDARLKDCFFHRSELIDFVFSDALMHQRVQFDVEESPKGPRATNVRPIE